MNPQISDYVRQARASGMSDAEIRANLTSAGWPAADIEAVFSPTPSAAPTATPAVPGTDPYVRSPKQAKLGVFFIAGPFIMLILVMIAYAIVTFAFTSSLPVDSATGAIGLGPANPAASGLAMARAILGLLGILSVIGMFIGPLIGLVLLSKRELRSDVPYDVRSGAGPASTIPAEITGWNWGAAGMTFIWGVYYHVWLSLLIFIPLLSLIWMIVLGAKGNEWAWRSSRWLSVGHFQAAQRKWKVWGIVFFIFSIIFSLFSVALRTLLSLMMAS